MTPDIHTWWPELTIKAKHALREAPGEPLPDAVRSEIERITGTAVAEGTRLDASEARFIETQREQVD